MQRDAEGWLEQWADENLATPMHSEDKGDLQPGARQCVQDAEAQGYTVAEIKDAAGGDLERYLMKARNALADREGERKSVDD